MPAADRSSRDFGSVMGPARKLRAVTPHASDELEFVANGIMATSAGNIAIVAQDDTEAVIVPVLAGQVYPIRVKAVRVSGTTATGIVALMS